MLYKIRYDPVDPLNGAIPRPYVTVRVTHATLVVYQYTYAPPRCRTSQYRRTFILYAATLQNLAAPHDFMLSESLWSNLANPVWCGTGGFQEHCQCFFIFLSCSIPTIKFSNIFPFIFFLSIGSYCGAEVFGLLGCISLSLCLALPIYFNNNNNNWWPRVLRDILIN